MFVMHLYFVCKMNMFARAFVVCISVVATTGAAEIRSDYKASVATTKSNEVTTPRWKESIKTGKWEQPTTKRVEPSKFNKWEQPDISTKFKEPIKSNKWEPTTLPTKWRQPTTIRTIPTNRQNPVNHKVVAVASTVDDSRNGRLSSMNDFEVYPDSSMVKTDNKGNFIFKSVNGKMPMPITITKQGDGVSGTIRILPGSISVSSSASSPGKSGPSSATASLSPWSNSFMMPLMNDFYFPPFPVFPSIPDPVYGTGIPDMSFNRRMSDPFYYLRMPEPHIQSRIQDPWINRNTHKQSHREQDIFTPKWYYPSFNPFINFW